MWKPVEFEDIKVGDRLMVTDKWGTFDYGAVRRKGEISLSFDGVTISMCMVRWEHIFERWEDQCD
jgi:hypothetical protein